MISDEMVKTAGFRSGMMKAAESEEQKRRRMELRGKGSAIGANIGTAAGAIGTAGGLIGARALGNQNIKNIKGMSSDPERMKKLLSDASKLKRTHMGIAGAAGIGGTMLLRNLWGGAGSDVGGAVGRYKNMKENKKG